MYFNQVIAQLKVAVREHLAQAPECHDYDHVKRVLNNALELMAFEKKVDSHIVVMAVLLHDIARPEELAAKGRICHAQKGAEMVRKYLEAAGVHDEKIIESVAGCVRKHRYRDIENCPETIEEKIVYDSDKLDALGAIGLGRAFHFAGRIGARVHNSDEDALLSEEYSKNDSAYREYLVKLRRMKDKMLTKKGREVAEERTKFMDSFFQVLNKEVFD